MRKTTPMIHRPTSNPSTAFGLLNSGWAHFFNRSAAMGSSTRILVTAAGLLCIGLVGWINFHAAKGLTFEYFYLLICALVGWSGGARSALACALAGAALSTSSEIVGSHGSLSAWVILCNTIVRLLAFVGIGRLAADVGRSTRDLRQTIEHRTAHLRREVQKHKQTAEWLREAMEIFKQVTENIADVFWVTNPLKTQVDYISPGFEGVWGRACQTLYVSPGTWIEGIHHEDRERVTRAMLSKQATGEYDEEYRVVRPDGSVRWVHDRAFPVRDEQGAIYRVVGIAEDITERKRTEHLLQAEREVGVMLGSTSDLQSALERLLEVAVQLEGIDCGGVYLIDPETGELNLKAHRGLSGSFVARIAHYKTDAAEARVAKSGRSLYMRQDQIPRGLEVLWGSEGLKALAVVPVQHKGTAVGLLNLASYQHEEIVPRTRVGIEMIASQVAGAIARIRAEESLRASEMHLRTIVNSAPIALLAIDARGTITFEDGQALAALGTKPGEHLRQPAEEVYRDFPIMHENIRRGLRGEEFSSVFEFDSTVFECRHTPVHDKSGHPAGLIAVAVDVTERFRLQRQILEISDREQARIGQDIHDGLCQQLISVAIGANSLQQTLDSERRSEAVTARKICRLLDEAITEARCVCQGLYPIRLSTQGLSPALQELAAETSERHGLPCVCEVSDPMVQCDTPTATHLYRIAQEAVNNAVKHSKAQNLTIRLAASGKNIALEIRDDGKWVNRTPTRNSGMGMHIMDYRAQLIGGSLHCESGERGTVVSCRVPQA
jgi:PAS domain S-box-containing protein